MSGQYGTSRSGWDAPTRIATSTSMMLAESTELPPAEPLYQPIIPFNPTYTPQQGELSYSMVGDRKVWKRFPSRCDISFYQGDDVIIPFYFNDPNVADDDMASGFTWFAQIRTLHSYRSTLVNDFITRAEFQTGSDETNEYTTVEMFLPRTDNIYSGVYRWEIAAYDTEDLSRFPKPDDVDPADWPPPDQLRTWLYGICTIVPRVTSTDVLPTEALTVIGGGGAVPAVDAGPFVVGPNGRVP